MKSDNLTRIVRVVEKHFSKEQLAMQEEVLTQSIVGLASNMPIVTNQMDIDDLTEIDDLRSNIRDLKQLINALRALKDAVSSTM